MEENMKIQNNLDLVEYVALVDNIAEEYFDSDGRYTPHFGQLNAMRQFYNCCVKDDICGLSHDINDAIELKPIVKNEDFIKEFDTEITRHKTSSLSFGNAYQTALEIVDAKKQSIYQVVECLKSSIEKLLNNVTASFTPENLAMIEKIASGISNINSESIVEAIGKSERFKEIINNKEAI